MSGDVNRSSWWGDMKRRIGALAAFSILAVALATGPAFAQANVAARITQCISDNKDEEQEPNVLKVYCTCMSNLMGPTVTVSIKDWEATHKKEEETCADKAGWED